MNKEKKAIIQSSLLVFSNTILSILPIFVVVNLVMKFIKHSLHVEVIIKASSIIFIFYISKMFISKYEIIFTHKLAFETMLNLRIQIINHLKKLPLGFFQTRMSGALSKIMQYDIEQIETYLAHVKPMILSAYFLPILIFIFMLLLDFRLALLLVSTLPIMFFLQWFFAKFIWIEFFKTFTKIVSKMQEDLSEYVANISIIKTYGKDERKTNEVLSSVKNYIVWVGKSLKIFSLPMAFIAILMDSGVVLVIIVGSYLFNKGDLDINIFILSIILSEFFSSSISKMPTFQHFKVIYNQNLKEINSILHEPIIKDKNLPLNIQMGDIVFENVNFAYPSKKQTLQDINLTIKQGTTTTLIGSSGSGKTTLAHLILGFWNANSGKVSINKTDVSKVSDKALSALVSIVSQEVFLFNLSIKENIKIANPKASDEDIINSCKKAMIYEFIQSLPNGFDTLVAEDGVKLSGGQKQRISIARMFLKHSPIIILDEATSGLDAQNESYIAQAIHELKADKTVIIIAHKLKGISHSKQIVVMDEGKIISKGTHEELLENCKTYKNMLNCTQKAQNWQLKEKNND